MKLKLLQGGVFGRQPDQPPSTPDITTADDALLDAYSATVIRAVEQASPAVVGIRRRSSRQAGQEAMIDGSGSGVVIAPDGYVLTNYHVTHGARSFEVGFHDGMTSPAELVGGDPDTDLALLRVARTGLTPGTLGRFRQASGSDRSRSRSAIRSACRPR